jgi:sigma-B regulation protein RsbU (phosphoserine phosphatase)
MLKNKGIAFKLISLVLLSIGLIFISIFIYSYFFSRQIIVQKIRENAFHLTQSMVYRIDGVLKSLEKIPEGLACFLEHGFYPLFVEHGFYAQKELLKILEEVVKNNPEIYGCIVAFEPYAFNKKMLYFAPYFYKKNDKVNFTYIGGENYQYFYWDWYQLPKILKRAVWSEPYYGKGGGILMSTYSVPFYRVVNGKREFWGVVAVDISLSWLQNLVSSIKVAQTGYGFLISKNGTFITHPQKKLIMNETIFSLAEERHTPYLREIGKKMIHGEKGFVPVNSIVTGKRCWLAYTPLPANGWSLGVLFPQMELMADVTKLNRHVVCLGILGLLFLSGVIILIAGTITRPLRALTSVTRKLATGDLDIEIPYLDLKDEVGELAKAFDYMKKSLKAYIKNLQETTAAKERVESELKIAADIQLSMLPRTFPPFPDRGEFDIFAIMEPAKEVGGDFYDFFFVDKDKLCFLIADVSGKGVPASLFMAILKFLLKTEALRRMPPEKILFQVNNTLCPDNEACMFATVFCAILDIKTGEVHFANAGHNPPLLWEKEGKVEFLKVNKGFVLGVMEGVAFKGESLWLKPGDMLILYTDGVTEAMNSKKELFSKERLKDVIAHLKEREVKQVVYKVREAIKLFVEDAPQSDDITMLVVKFKG